MEGAKLARRYQHTSRRSNYILYAAFYEQNFSQNVFIIIETCSASGGSAPRPPFQAALPPTPTRDSASGPRWEFPSSRPPDYVPRLSSFPRSSFPPFGKMSL